MTADERMAITRLLVGFDYLEQYQNSAVFYTSVNTLVRMLPTFIRGMSDEAKVVDERLAASIEAARVGVWSTPL